MITMKIHMNCRIKLVNENENLKSPKNPLHRQVEVQHSSQTTVLMVIIALVIMMRYVDRSRLFPLHLHPPQLLLLQTCVSIQMETLNTMCLSM